MINNKGAVKNKLIFIAQIKLNSHIETGDHWSPLHIFQRVLQKTPNPSLSKFTKIYI